MDEYEALGHMSESALSECADDSPNFYLPHHAVLREQSTTTKLRVVLDGSAKTTSGLSLNDVQHVGPVVQAELFSIVLRFRQHSYVLSADITKMYRQIKITDNQRTFQRILWRKDSSLPIKHYKLNTVTYGTASAPFLAIRCLQEISNRCKEQYPVVSNVIRHDFYVDDLLSGTDTIEKAIELKNQLNDILGKAGMELRKWASNDPRILHQTEHVNKGTVTIEAEKSTKTLGIFWDPNTDTLRYYVSNSDTRKITKRTILSIIAQIFDPLGLIGPAIVQAKIMLQRLWNLQLDWDEVLPQELHTSWLKIYNELTAINEIRINRHIITTDCTDFETHGFCDASEKAYGACIYVCSKNRDGARVVRLLCAKSRVAPLKSTTLPRLELLGALLLAQLADKVTIACNLEKHRWHFWTDSTVVLAWIKAPSNKWKTFVANRTAEIQRLTNENWHHVESAFNPADLISRGINSSELLDASLWWNGPSWLAQDKTNWPNFQKIDTEEAPEQRKITLATISQEVYQKETEEVTQTNDYMNTFFNRFSSFTRLIRTTAYIFRFIENCKETVKQNSTKRELRKGTIQCNIIPLRTAELETATMR